MKVAIKRVVLYCLRRYLASASDCFDAVSVSPLLLMLKRSLSKLFWSSLIAVLQQSVRFPEHDPPLMLPHTHVSHKQDERPATYIALRMDCWVLRSA